MIRNRGQARCSPLEPTSTVADVTKNVMPMMSEMAWAETGGRASSARIAAKPHQATDVTCQANRRVRVVNSGLPKSLEKIRPAKQANENVALA
jgi:hypothetical protein